MVEETTPIYNTRALRTLVFCSFLNLFQSSQGHTMPYFSGTTMIMSMLRLRYALSIPRFPCFLVCCHPAITLHSWPLLFHNPNDVIVSFNRMLRECPTPPIFQFNKILGSLVKNKHYTPLFPFLRNCNSLALFPLTSSSIVFVTSVKSTWLFLY